MNKISQFPATEISVETFDPSQDPFTTTLIGQKVKQLLRRKHFTPSDEEDLTQDLLLAVFKGLASFDSDVGHLYPFIKTIVEREVAGILRNASRSKRDSGDQESLNVNIEVSGAGSMELAQNVSNNDFDRRTGRERLLTEEEISSLRLDSEQIIAQLPSEKQEMLRRLKTQSMTQIGKEMGIPRKVIAMWVDEVQLRFEAAGIKKYFQN